ncbi:ankyrin repeat domain-containing protein 17 isoform X4 [Spodoptera frugiperda]|uniref:Ankyrin repeat domain-containing protein 17 isoform X4 n=1 Tax=Spodoptera frugiperda TaxID=7108 RepID=A0A9R0EBM7_SPOFR|nr:ankyrin repeat domain-containing protein 17 isoform X4 [Spodoptera frugiperda]
MQNVGQSENRNIDKVNVQLDVVKSSTPQSSASSPAKSETETYSGAPAKYMTDSSESEDDSVSEILLACLCLSRPDLLAEMEEEGGGAEPSKFLLSHDDPERAVDPEMQARLEALLEAAGIGKLSGEGKHLADPEVLRRLTSSVSCALDEAAAALTRMRSDQPPPHHRHHHQDKNFSQQCGSSATGTTPTVASSVGADGAPSLAEACSDGDVGTVRKLLTEGRSVHETTEEGESLLSLACSAGYYELAQVLLAMHASVEDRGIKGDCTPLMEAASAGHVDIVRLLIAHHADVNAVSGSGNTPLMYACAGGHEECVRALLESGANVEDHNENGHTPLMEAASAGHVGVAKILLEHGAGINTHSNEFKESALTLACYKGHLDMVRFLLAAGADREHKTDEMHTALMEASMDGHVEVARLLLDSGAQVNMPTDSFESPLTLAACGGHVELAMLLLERGANIEEVNDEGYTPLMEAAREGHEEMVALLLGQGASINAQTEETQETALTLACCGGFLEVADFLIKAGADAELGASTPLMEASQEGHLELVRYLLKAGADVNAQTQTGDTALTYACENGHTDVADLLLREGAQLEHESEGGRTPLMKACRAGHVCTVQFLVGKGADVNRMTALGDHTPLSLACAGGHVDVVKFLLACDADPFRKLKDNSTMLIEAAKGGHAAVVLLLLDYPHSVMLPRGNATAEEAGGLSAAQAAALGLAHAAAPGAAGGPAGAAAPRALLPAAAEAGAGKFSKVYLDERGLAARKKPEPEPSKHKCTRKQRAAPPHSDHHLPPPPDILDDNICHHAMAKVSLPPGFTWKDVNKKVKIKCQIKNKCNRDPRDCLPDADRSLLDLPDPAGPPTLATSALHALDLQFCAQGVTTVHPPTTPPYPPPQQLFPVQQLATNLNQHQLQELQQQQFQQLAVQQQQQHQQQQHQQQQQQKKQQQQQQQQLYVQELQQRPEAFAAQLVEAAEGAGGAEAAGVEARELGAVLAYLQREVPSLVALPPNELRSLVLQVMQQKSHEILSSKCAEAEADRGDADADDDGHERHARRLLEEALSADWPRQDHHHHHHHHHHHVDVTASNGCQFRLRPSSPSGKLESGIILTRADNDILTIPQSSSQPQPQQQPHAQPDLQPHFALPPPTLPYEDYRSATFAASHAGAGGAGGAAHVSLPAAAHGPPPQPAPQHSKRDQHHHSTAKKKNRFAGTGRGCRSGEAFGTATPPAPAPAAYCAMDVDGETDSNHDTALTLACAGGHEDLVELLLSRGADIEHRDKKGFTPLILAATAGHEKIVEILLNHGADIEAQSERTKDTPLSLACSGGRYEVVELILSRGANKEHRNVSDYTPLSLAASGGYVNIIRLLLTHQAEINSRTGSKLGISPLMLAAMNGHTAAVRLLLDCGSDINAQIETNRNTALTLACFQGRHEVVSLLLDRKANVEHRAKTGLTPLMEAASGGYVEVGRVLLDKGADVNAPPVPSSRDTALTIAADKGHTKFVELLLQRRAAVEVKNKKGNSPLWLAANGGHLAVVEMLYAAGADIDSQDNRKVSCLMAAFRKGHTKVVKWMVGVVTQFPSDQEMTRYICTISDKELLEKCQECVRVIRAAKETQAARANQNATILLEELDAERCREESRRQAAARRRERKKKKKLEKKSCMQEERRKLQAENDKNSMYCDKALGECSEGGEPDDEPVAKEEGDSGIDANSQGSCSSSDVKAPPVQTTKSKKKKKEEKAAPAPPAPPAKKQPDKSKPKIETKPEKESTPKPDKKQEKENVAPSSPPATPVKPAPPPERRPADKKDNKKPEEESPKSITVQNVNKYGNNSRKSQVFESTRHIVEKDELDTSDKNKKTHNTHQWETEGKSTSPKGGCVGGRREEGWKEVVRKSSVQTLSTVEPGCKKVSVASHAISRVIGRAGSNINAIRSATGAHIEVDKQSKGQGERIITIKGSAEATKQAGMLIAAMIRDPEADIVQLLPRATAKPAPQPLPLQPKTPKQPPPKQQAGASSSSSSSASSRTTPTARAPAKQHVRPAPPPVVSTEKRVATSSGSAASAAGGAKGPGALSYTGAIVGARTHTFAAKLTAAPAPPAPTQAPAPPPPAEVKPRPPPQPTSAPSSSPGSGPVGSAVSPQKTREPSPGPAAAAPLHKPDDSDKQHRLPDRTVQLSPDNSSSWSANEETTPNTSTALHINTTPQPTSRAGGQEYSLFKDVSGGAAVWGAAGDNHHNVEPPPPQVTHFNMVDASKAPGYRGGGGGAGGGVSPCSRTSSHGSTPPPAYAQPSYHQPMPIGNHANHGNNVNTMDMSGLSRNGPIYQDNSRNGHNMMQQVSMSSGVNMSGAALGLGYVGVESVSRLNPRAPDFAQRHPLMQQKHNAQLFAGTSNAGNLSALLMSYQQQQAMPQSPKPMQHAPQQHHAYQSLLERGVGVSSGGWGEEEERKPRPIGTERAWKLTAAEDWGHAHVHHQLAEPERYGAMGHAGHALDGAYGGVGSVGGGATAAALSLMHALPLHYLPPVAAPEPPPHWDPAHAADKQVPGPRRY